MIFTFFNVFRSAAENNILQCDIRVDFIVIYGYNNQCMRKLVNQARMHNKLERTFIGEYSFGYKCSDIFFY